MQTFLYEHEPILPPKFLLAKQIHALPCAPVQSHASNAPHEHGWCKHSPLTSSARYIAYPQKPCYDCALVNGFAPLTPTITA